MIIAALLMLVQTPGGVSVDGVFARDIPARSRSLIRVDPVELELIENRLDPAKGWTKRDAGGWNFKPSGYVWVKVRSPKAQVLQLNASGVSMFYMNGEPRVGDVYGYGTFFVPVPLKKGVNDVLLFGFRGEAKLNWRVPTGSLQIDAADATLPDYDVAKDRPFGDMGSVVVLNNTGRMREATVGLKGTSFDKNFPVMIPAYGVAKVPFSGITASEITVVGKEGKATFHERKFKLETPKAGEPFRFTFQSDMDRSVQYAAINPSRDPKAKVGVLSLHGASVEAIGQARAYGQKDFCHIVCPTNRRPFGFNWEGIGREDAYEAMFASKRYIGEPERWVLTGHSMGGHGTWHLGVHDPMAFAMIAPCAGWISFDTYAGGANYDLNDPVQKLLNKANIASNTLLFKNNLALTSAVYIHHGAADETVPVTEARRMREELKGIANVVYHEEPGAGHWFDNNPEPGADSVDWKPMMDMFRTAKSPPIGDRFEFIEGNATSGAGHRIASIGGQIRRNEISKVSGERKADGWHLTTTNAHVLYVHDRTVKSVDGIEIAHGPAEYGATELRRRNGKWTVIEFEDRSLGRGDRGDHTQTTFNDVYNQRIVFVVPDAGTKEERDWAWKKARYDMEQMWYRGNATPQLLIGSDADVDSNWELHAIYYGHAAKQTFVNKLSKVNRKLPPATALFEVLHSGDHMYVQITGSDAKGRRLAERFPLFSPGVGYPNYLAADVRLLKEGAKGIVGAGYLGPDGELEGSEFVWRD